MRASLGREGMTASKMLRMIRSDDQVPARLHAGLHMAWLPAAACPCGRCLHSTTAQNWRASWPHQATALTCTDSCMSQSVECGRGSLPTVQDNDSVSSHWERRRSRSRQRRQQRGGRHGDGPELVRLGGPSKAQQRMAALHAHGHAIVPGAIRAAEPVQALMTGVRRHGNGEL